MKFRAVKNELNEIIAMGVNEDQSGLFCNTDNSWCDFTFDEVPEIPTEIQDWINENKHQGYLFKVVDNNIIVKTLEEIQN